MASFSGGSFSGAVGGFSVDVTVTSGIVGGGTARFYTPYEALPGRKKRRRIDELVVKEAALKEQIVAIEDTGTDSRVLEGLYAAIKALQLALLEIALESERNSAYIARKRQEEEDEDLLYILQLI